MIIAVINQKGGAGKTTLAVHLACHLADEGRRVAFVDNDPQLSATRWLKAAAPAVPVHTITDAPKLVEAIQSLDHSHDAVVCDGAPRLSDQTHVLMYFAGRILIPVRPSMLDLQATLETKIAIDKVREARLQDGLGEPDVRLVLNMVRSIGEQSKVMRKALRDLGMPLTVQTVGLRDAYSKAVVDDSVVTRMKKDKGAIQASQELLSLFNEVLPDELRQYTAAAA
jgi:chromosome partitioning protein